MADQRREFCELASLEGANVSRLCVGFGISRQTGYVWLRRYRAGEVLEERSRRPHVSPRRSPAALEAQILALRAAHPVWGARKLARLLEDVAAPSTVHAVLARHGRIGPAARRTQAYGRFERASPNELWQMDFKGRLRLGCGTWCHTLTVIDDHSRYAVVLEACADEQTATVRGRLERALRHHGLPQAIYVDNGAPWGGGRPEHWTPLRVWLLKLGIQTIPARPRHPQGRGKNERFHRSLDEEVFDLALLRGLDEVQAALDAWRTDYNQVRPHEGIGLAVPASRYRPSPRPFPERLPEPHYDSDTIVRRVGTTKAYIQFRGRLWKVPKAFRGEPLAIRPYRRDGRYAVCFGATKIATIDLRKPDTPQP